jgi:tetratricopeptide (TPR) repeat protein
MHLRGLGGRRGSIGIAGVGVARDVDRGAAARTMGRRPVLSPARHPAAVLPVLLALGAGACATATTPAANTTYRVDARGSFHRAFTAANPEAARLCEQGLLLCYAFNHEEAAKRFEEAAKADPNCAMAYWGIAFAAGPNINNPKMDAKRSREAAEAAREAVARMGRASPCEQALILALSRRYVEPPPDDRSTLDRAYADVMREVAHEYPDDPDVGALFAEALMDLRPWDLWSKDGEPRTETLEIVPVLQAVLAKNPNHPGANHDLIHALEASPHPEKALPSANRLRDLIPEAGHLVHMPSHIDIRLGHYADGIETNRRGIEADRRLVAITGPAGIYTMYRCHNYHFLVYAAMFDGQSRLALESAREMLAMLPPELFAAKPSFVDVYLATPLHVMERFGMWDAILREPAPESRFRISTAFWHFSRGLALAALGRVEEAEAERAAFEKAVEAVPESASYGNNKARAVLAVGVPLLAGEIEYRKGNLDAGFALLREAASRDSDLAYNEPWGWMVPAAHALGALLLESGRVEEAEEVYRDDLKRHPNNGWSLHGLAECRRRSGDASGAESVDEMFAAAWSRADIKIPGSCFCRTK